MSIPYVVGQWVRGDRFYGRRALLREALEGSRDRLWVVGMRRVGKTSLLRQIEQLAGETPGGSVVPVVWDLQGSDEADELDLGLHDALLDAELPWIPLFSAREARILPSWLDLPRRADGLFVIAEARLAGGSIP